MDPTTNKRLHADDEKIHRSELSLAADNKSYSYSCNADDDDDDDDSDGSSIHLSARLLRLLNARVQYTNISPTKLIITPTKTTITRDPLEQSATSVYLQRQLAAPSAVFSPLLPLNSVVGGAPSTATTEPQKVSITKATPLESIEEVSEAATAAAAAATATASTTIQNSDEHEEEEEEEEAEEEEEEEAATALPLPVPQTDNQSSQSADLDDADDGYIDQDHSQAEGASTDESSSGGGGEEEGERQESVHSNEVVDRTMQKQTTNNNDN